MATNPRLELVVNDIFNAGSTKNALIADFDRLYGENRYSDIMKKYGEFAASVADDTSRKEKLKNIAETHMGNTMLISKAKSLKESGNPYAAWELLKKKATNKNLEISLLQVEISKNIIKFTQALDIAKENEDDYQYGSALAQYLKAKNIYPASFFAKDGINRIADKAFDIIE